MTHIPARRVEILLLVVALILLTATSLCEGKRSRFGRSRFHSPPNTHHESQIHERLHEILKTEAHLNSADSRSFQAESHAMQTLATNEWHGLRVKFDFTRLDNPKFTCQAPTPNERGMANSGSQSSVTNTAAYFAGQAPRNISVVDRTGVPSGSGVAATAAIKIGHCYPDIELSRVQKDFIKQKLAKKLGKMLNALVSPVVLNAGNGPIQGNQANGKTLECGHPHYTWAVNPANYLDTDLLFMVTTEPDHGLSWSLPCLTASDGRPTVIVLNINPAFLQRRRKGEAGVKSLQQGLLRSALKSLGMSMSMVPLWKQPVVIANVVSRGINIRRVVTPKVRQFVETAQFNCAPGALGGAELEDAVNSNSGFFWEKRIFRGEILTQPDFTNDNPKQLPPLGERDLVVSGLTLAAMEDTGWFVANKELARPLPWGLGEDCSFATQRCDEWPVDYKCNHTTPPQCNQDFMGIAACNLAPANPTDVPSHYLYDHTTNMVGADKLMDACPVLKTIKLCSELDGISADCDSKECPTYHQRGKEARCSVNNLRYKSFNNSDSSAPQAGCLRAVCRGSGPSLHIQYNVSGVPFTCVSGGERAGPGETGIVTPNGLVLLGHIYCPEPAVFCKRVMAAVENEACDPLETCNGHGTCVEGACQCFSSCGPDPSQCRVGSRGFFGGNTCGRCAEGFSNYPNCTTYTCPINPLTGQVCNGRGHCNDGTCACFANTSHGFFDPASDCKMCAPGFTGDGCKTPTCSVGSCTHGVCNLTSQRCVCDFDPTLGHWSGPSCSVCAVGYDSSNNCRTPLPTNCPTACPHVNTSFGVDYTTTDLVPIRPVPLDECGCPLGPSWPTGSSKVIDNSRRQTDCGTCPSFEPIHIDCKGYPMLFETCGGTDNCGCSSRPRPACLPGTDKQFSPDSILPKHVLPNGKADNRSSPVPSTPGASICRCPASTPPAAYSCLGPVDGDGIPIPSPMTVWFEPQQVFEEDFCHCVSPLLPRCSDATRPKTRPQLQHGTVFDCNQMQCPDWEKILNIGQKQNPTGPDLSIIDCDGFTPPKLSAKHDPCGCPFPQFKCRSGSEGKCPEKLDKVCPQWEQLEVNCQGHQPPVLNWHGPHPCGCPPPPPVNCLPETGPECDCSVKPHEIEYVDCKGMPLKVPEYNPHSQSPYGDPFIQPCDPCPMCDSAAPVRKCILGTDKPIQPTENVVSNCPNGPKSPFPYCEHFPTPCPVDCRGKPPPPPQTFDAACECPPPPQPPCIDGTDGTVTDTEHFAGTCSATPEMCYPYICGDAAGAAVGAEFGRIEQCEKRQPTFFNMLPQGAPAYCVQEGSCQSDNECVCGFKCGPCGMCIPKDKPVSGCLADPTVCGLYSCVPRCDDHGTHAIREGNLHGECVPEGQCTGDDDCQHSAVCAFSIHNKPTASSSIDDNSAMPMIPSPEDNEYLGEEEEGPTVGRCVIAPDPFPKATQYCYSHDECEGFVCGSHRQQEYFSHSRCLTSCAFDDHCHPDFRCDRLSHRCVQVTGTGSGNAPASEPQHIGCETHPHGFCAPYVCGAERGAQPPPNAQCRHTCTDDVHCAGGFGCNGTHCLPIEMEAEVDMTGPVLVVPIFDESHEDPTVNKVTIRPFKRPALTRMPEPGQDVGSSPANCRPYKAAVRGATAAQVENLREEALNGDSSLPTCKTSCASNVDCSSGFYCVTPTATEALNETSSLKGTCQTLRSLGTECRKDRQCASGFCVEGVCCNTACDKPCQTCHRMGICGFVSPRTDRRNQCGSCMWCDYLPDAVSGAVLASSPLTCTPMPLGIDVKGSCKHGTCNGEGGCKADKGWAGVLADTCAPGYSGENCDVQHVEYREVEVQEKYEICSADEVAHTVGAPSPDETAVQSYGSSRKRRHHVLSARQTFSRRTATGLETVSGPSHYQLRKNVVDRRPRQHVHHVLGVSSHSDLPCSNIIGSPPPPQDRIHGHSTTAWAPSQYHKKPDGSVAREDLKYFPWVDCRIHDNAKLHCEAQTGCKFVENADFSFCTGDGSVQTAADAEALLKINPYKVTSTKERVYDKELMTPPPLQWIEIEIKEAVFVEAIQLFENSHPGSLVRVEVQPMLNGSEALSHAGGGVPSSDDLGGEEMKGEEFNIRKTATPHLEEACSSRTPQGRAICEAYPECVWEVDNRCHHNSSIPHPTGESHYNRSANEANSTGTGRRILSADRVFVTQNSFSLKQMHRKRIATRRHHYNPKVRHVSSHRFAAQSESDVNSAGEQITNPVTQSYVQPFCAVAPDYTPSPGEALPSAEECAARPSHLCFNGTSGCYWFDGTASGAAPFPPPTTSSAEQGSYGTEAQPPRQFSLQDAGPEYDPNAAPIDIHAMPPSPGPVQCEDVPAGGSTNPNPKPFITVWQRDQPNFPPESERRYRSQTVNVGMIPSRSKVVRLTFSPVSNGRTEIEAIAVVGAAVKPPPGELLCGGEIWVSPVPEGTPSSAVITAGAMTAVPCSGNGKCGVRGCECFGNFDGKDCETCKLGFTGSGCDQVVEFGCERAFYEDLTQLGSEVVSRWKFKNYRFFESTATPLKHFGSSMVSPKYTLASGFTHIAIKANVLVVDIPQGDDVGIFLTVARNQLGDDMTVAKIEKPQFYSGMNLIGTENGDAIADISAKIPWKFPSIVVNVTLWWGGSSTTNDFTMSLNSVEIEACTMPDLGLD